jgi:hypothetical protein
MKNYILCFLCLQIVSGPLLASDIYKKVDKDGAVTFSDQPQADAEKIKIEAVNVQPHHKALPSGSLSEKKKFAYASLVITSPENDSTLRNSGETVVSATLTPSLRSDHKVEILDNGKLLQPAGRVLTLSLSNLDRGTHSFVFRVIDTKGNTLISSGPVNLHIHRNFIKPASPPPPAS